MTNFKVVPREPEETSHEVNNNTPLTENYYNIKVTWESGKDETRSYTDDAVRTFATIKTSGTRCKFFNKEGKQMSLEEFTSKYNEYSGETFLVTMNKTSGDFIIKVSASRLIEYMRGRKGRTKTIL